jgi:cyanate permease
MTHADWLFFAKFTFAAFIIFYLRVWRLESSRAGSWRAGHAMLWKKPKKWQVVTFCVLWGLIIIAFIVAYSTQRQPEPLRESGLSTVFPEMAVAAAALRPYAVGRNKNHLAGIPEEQKEGFLASLGMTGSD